MSHHGSHHMSHHGSYHLSHHGDHHTSHLGKSKKSHHGGHYKKEVSFSKYVTHGPDDHHGGFKVDSLFDVNEKEIMQLLNERLSSYLSKVRSLEMENAQLEKKICEWYENNPPKTPPDGTQYFRIINELQNQIMEASMENADIMLQIDDARLAAADYRSKYELELTQSNNAEMDVNNLSRALEGLNGENSELEKEVQSLEEEKNCLEMNSEEEIESLLSQLGARINVEMNAAPSIDLNEALSEIREEYENLMERNLKEAEDMFLEMSGDLSREVASSSEELQSVNTELIEMKHCVQALEIDLQSELSLISALEGTLAETEAIFGSKLAELQCLINNLESKISTIRSNLERQNYEYKVLMDQKTHLEMEIATYKRLLDGHDIDISEHDMSHGKHGRHVGSYHYVKHHSKKHHYSGQHHEGHHSSGHQSGEHHSSNHHKYGKRK
ncbi:keratin, type I cytoskeletal 19-like [Leptodactylus fuscus]|uniref:keratin, type I cytoskeletal 19-like n=1 Tax=Leptodactylus fuscus TaxID=238119 RepID=UPI003F4EAC6E